jgi:7-keto-8-aminopelargonate synthetase-like enzyme
VVTESLFSMDGDLAPLADLHDVCAKHDAFLYVDEAHAIGVVGPDGKGGCAAAGIRADDPLVIRMGTLGKSFGSYGAFVAGAPELVALLTSRSRGFIFTTGTPPAAAAAAEAALDVSLAEPQRRQGLLHRAAALRAVLAAQGWETGASAAQIVPLLLGDAELTMSASQTLLEAGVYCQGIRPPTVPPGTCRLRVSLTAAHGEAHLTTLCRALGELTTLREEATRRARG